MRSAYRRRSIPSAAALCARVLALGLCLAALAALPAAALPVEATVGSGSNTANVVIEFGDGASYLFEVLFAATEISGIDALTTIEAALSPSFMLDLIDFGPSFGIAVDGVTYDGHSNVGFIDPDGFWHYWTKEAELDPWVFSDVGASFRMLQDGSWDGWKYGAGAPVPEPGTGVLVAIGLVGLGVSRRRIRAQPSVA